ncbi:hypothetical protein FRB90_004415, partial [Tulasnella sp. 427]
MEQPQSQSDSARTKTVVGNYTPNVLSGFGHIGDFWKQYDELADRSDRKMLVNLNGNLDVLLIF